MRVRDSAVLEIMSLAAHLARGHLVLEAAAEELTLMLQEPAAQVLCPAVSQPQYKVRDSIFPPGFLSCCAFEMLLCELDHQPLHVHSCKVPRVASMTDGCEYEGL